MIRSPNVWTAAIIPGTISSPVRAAKQTVMVLAAAYGFHLAFGKDSPFVENVYSRGVFVGLRWVWDRTAGLKIGICFSGGAQARPLQAQDQPCPS